MFSPSLLSRQPYLSCCAFWAQAELALYQIMLLILQRFVKNRTFDINRPLARIKSPVFCGTYRKAQLSIQVMTQIPRRVLVTLYKGIQECKEIIGLSV